MWEFLTITGKYGALSILFLVVFVFVFIFLLAMPGKEIHLWGVKFHKNHIDVFGFFLRIFRLWRSLPENIPDSWFNVLSIIYRKNDGYLSIENFKYYVRQEDSNVSDYLLICDKMQKYGLITIQYNHLRLTEKGLNLYHELKNEHEDGD